MAKAVQTLKPSSPEERETVEHVLEAQAATDQAVINAKMVEALAAITSASVSTAAEYIDLKAKIVALDAKLDLLLAKATPVAEVIAEARAWRQKIHAATTMWLNAHQGQTKPLLNVYPYNGAEPIRHMADGSTVYAIFKDGDKPAQDAWIVTLPARAEGLLRTTSEIKHYIQALHDECKVPASSPARQEPPTEVAPSLDNLEQDLSFL